MEYALAHDENGSPLDVPATAVGWLVRRHAGGRGRPAAVYDPEGRPLLVPLDATASDLRAEGCRAGTYRLDAVDSSRRLLNVVAYTEVLFDGAVDSGLDAAPSAMSSDAAVAALARAVEAMQRVQAERERAQAERERVQAEMLARLVDRLAPPAPTQPRSLSEALGEFEQASKVIRNLAPEPELDDEEDDPPAGLTAASPVIALLDKAIETAKSLAILKFGAPAPAVRNAAPPAAEIDEECDDEEGENDESEPPNVAGIDPKLDAVLALLAPAEVKRVEELSRTLDESVITRAMQTLMILTPEQGAMALRQMLEQHPSPSQASA